MKKMYTAQEVAERYAVSVESVWRWIRAGRLPAMRLTTRNYRIRPADLEAFERGEGLGQVETRERFGTEMLTH